MADPYASVATPAPTAPARGADPYASVAMPMADLDSTTGAPANVRGAVGAASTPEDRLATLRRFAPDARPMGADNFVFTNPRTQRLTVYNPRGLDWGDFSSIRPEIGEMLGGTIGGALALPPSVAGVPFTGGASLLGVAAGVGLGAAAGREIATATTTIPGDTVDTRSMGTRAVDAATTAGANAVGVPVGNALARFGAAVLGPIPRMLGMRTGAPALDDFTRAGVTPSAGAVSGNPLLQNLEGALDATPGGVSVMRGLTDRQAAQVQTGVRNIAGEIGTSTTPGDAGAALRQGATNATERFTARQGQLYDEAFARVGADTPAQLTNTYNLGAELANTLARAPESRDAVLRPVLTRIEQLAADGGERGLPFDALRAVRTDIGRILGTPRGAATAPSSDTRVYLERLYGALTEDMTAAARAQGPEAAQALAVADRYTRLNRTQNLPVLERILAQRTDEGVFNMAFPRDGRPDVQSLTRIRRNMAPDEWNVLSATVLDRMGMPTSGVTRGADDFSVSTFLTNFDRLTRNDPAAARVLFGAGDNARLMPELDRLVRVAGSLRDTARYANTSNTARATMVGAALYSGGGDALSGDTQGVLQTLGLAVVAPNVAARLITNPSFVRWLANSAPQIARSPETADRALLRLGQVAMANPELRDAIAAYQQAFTTMQPAPQRAPTPAAR